MRCPSGGRIKHPRDKSGSAIYYARSEAPRGKGSALAMYNTKTKDFYPQVALVDEGDKYTIKAGQYFYEGRDPKTVIVVKESTDPDQNPTLIKYSFK